VGDTIPVLNTGVIWCLEGGRNGLVSPCYGFVSGFAIGEGTAQSTKPSLCPACGKGKSGSSIMLMFALSLQRTHTHTHTHTHIHPFPPGGRDRRVSRRRTAGGRRREGSFREESLAGPLGTSLLATRTATTPSASCAFALQVIERNAPQRVGEQCPPPPPSPPRAFSACGSGTRHEPPDGPAGRRDLLCIHFTKCRTAMCQFNFACSLGGLSPSLEDPACS